ncbi:MAG: hypothetical protein CMF63_06035 [Magnetovibrio sp.]|nr:hypothetical protein [Magnetovibrio sp.]
MDDKIQETKQVDKKKQGEKNIRALYMFIFLGLVAFFLLILFIGYSIELYYKEKDRENMNTYNQNYMTAFKE